METEGVGMEREDGTIKHLHKPQAVYQLQHETEPVIMLLVKQAAGKDFYPL